MSKLTARAHKGEIEVILKMQHMHPGVSLTIEESRALRGELEKAEEEAEKKESAFEEWMNSHVDPYTYQVWNAAIEAAIRVMPELASYDIDLVRALKEPVE